MTNGRTCLSLYDSFGVTRVYCNNGATELLYGNNIVYRDNEFNKAVMYSKRGTNLRRYIVEGSDKLVYKFENQFSDNIGTWDMHSASVRYIRYSGDHMYWRNEEHFREISFDDWLDRCLLATVTDLSAVADPPTVRVESDPVWVSPDYILIDQI